MVRFPHLAGLDPCSRRGPGRRGADHGEDPDGAAGLPGLRGGPGAGQPALHSFARGIRRDQHAVTAGLALTCSSGAPEGKNCKIKHLRRLMYGRANFGLLQTMALLN